MTTHRLLDPSGALRAAFDGEGTPETLLRFAWRLGPSDRFSVMGLDDDAWALTIYRPGQPIKPQFVGPKGTRDLSVLLELAWLSLLDEGWTVDTLTH